MILFLAKFFRKLRPVSAIILQRNKELLIVKKPRKHNAWQFPQGGVDEGETFFAAAKRELGEECGLGLVIKFLSSKPIGEYSYFFPKDFKRHKKGIVGANVRFFIANWISGKVQVDGKEIIDYKWVSRDELKDFFGKEYLEKVMEMIDDKVAFHSRI
jgi:large subunit ribosomal protein L46